MVQTVGDSHAEGKGQGHSGQADGQGNLPVLGEEANINLEGNQEEEYDQAQIRDIVQDGDGFGGEDGGLKVGNAHHDRRAQQDAANDLGDDARLSHVGERIVEKTAEDDDDGSLDDEQGNGARGAVLDRIGALQDASLGRRRSTAVQGVVDSIEGSDAVDGRREQQQRQHGSTTGETAVGHGVAVICGSRAEGCTG